MDNATSGANIGAQIRRLRGKHMTQAQLAASASVSLDLIRKLEQGSRQTASLPYLHRIARALDVEITDLLQKPKTLPAPSESSGVVALRRAVTAVDDLFTTREDEIAEDEPNLEELRRAVRFGWGAYWAGRYDQAGEVLPDALVTARALDRTGAAADVIARLYQAASALLVHLAQPDAAHLAIREAIRTAEAGTDPLLPAALRASMSWLLLTQGRFAEAEKVATGTADSIEPGTETELPRMALFGYLLVRAATAAGRERNTQRALALLSEAADVSKHTGYRNDYESAFGPDLVTMQRVDTHVVTEEYGDALAAAKRMPRDTPLPLAARARHLEDRALAHTRLRQDDQAVNTLLALEQLAPREWIRHQVHPRLIVRELQERERRASRHSRLGELAHRWAVSA